MPPQVRGADPAKRPVVQSQNGVDQTTSGKTEKKASPEPQNATQSSGSHCASPKEKSQKTLEKSMEGSSWFSELTNALGDAAKNLVKDSSEERATKGGKGNSNSWFTELAKNLGELEEKQAKKMKAKEATPEELKANSQELSTINEAVNTAVKAIGEGISTAARKQ